MAQNNILATEKDIRLFCIRVEALLIKIKTNRINDLEKNRDITALYNEAEVLKSQIDQIVCKDCFVQSFNVANSKIINLHFEILVQEEIRRDL